MGYLSFLTGAETGAYILLIVIGLMLAFRGRKILERFFFWAGGFIGAVAGAILGFYYYGLAGGVILAIILILLLGYLFKILFKLAFAFLLTLLVYFVVIFTTGSVWASLLVSFLGFIVILYYINAIISLATASAGGGIAGFAVAGLSGDIYYGAGAGVAVLILGFIVQVTPEKVFTAHRTEKKPCPRCNEMMDYITSEGNYYCFRCRAFENEDVDRTCPECKNLLVFRIGRMQWYCKNCGKYM
jgi:ribosomal protein L37AE/L43A